MPKKERIQQNSITTWSVVKIILVIISALLIYVLRDIIGVILVAIFLATAITPLVDWFQKHKIPRPLAMVIIYITLLVFVSFVIGFLIAPISRQYNDIVNRFPGYYDQVIQSLEKIQGGSLGGNGIEQSINEWLGMVSGKAGSGLLSALSNLFGGIVFFVIVLVIVFYMAVEQNAIKKIVDSVVPKKYQEEVICLFYKIQSKLGHWLRSQLILGAIIAGLTFLFLLPVMPKYALVLALFAGMVEFIPYVGPFLGAVPAIFLAFNFGSWFMVIYVIVAYFIMQQAENHLIVPQVMKRAVGLNPIVSITAVMIGARLGAKFFGIGTFGAVLGVFLAIPTTIIILEIVDFYSDRKSGKKECKIS